MTTLITFLLILPIQEKEFPEANIRVFLNPDILPKNEVGVLGQRSAAPGWRVSVADNGPGIPEEDLTLVFEKFRQASSRGEKPIGTGLGLPICREIVQRFGGRIWAESDRGKGATLLFELPAEPPAPDAAQ